MQPQPAPTKAPLYDPRCEDLALALLGEVEPIVVRDLALHLEGAIEEWFRGTGHVRQ